jgi:Nucleoside-diphosphate-sugar epimerases
MTKILIIGSSGFTGRHLKEFLASHKGVELFLSDLTLTNEKNYTVCELTNKKSTNALIDKIKPDQIYNLAGSLDNDFESLFKGNVIIPRNILDAVLELKIKCRVLLIGSASEYGFIKPEDNPIKETHLLNPVSTYSLSKIFQTELMKYYYSLHDMDIVMARPFNLLGKGLSNKLFIGRIYEQIELFKQGKTKKITLGNLSAKRDYIEGPDAAKALYTIMQYGRSGEIYNVGSGKSISIKDLLEKILTENRLSMDVVESLEKTPDKKFDVPDIYADIQKLSYLSQLGRKD